MLTKKQLKELAKNYGMKINPDDMPAVAAARAALAYREMLERLEWVYDQQKNRMVCPACGAIKVWQPTHIKNCELAKLLKEECSLMNDEKLWELWEDAYAKAKEEVKDLPVVIATGKKGYRKGRPLVFMDVPTKGNKELILKLKSIGWRSCRGMNVQGKRILEFEKTY